MERACIWRYISSIGKFTCSILFSLLALFSLAHANNDAFSINTFSDEFDHQFIDQTILRFMQQYQIPGLSIAIARQENIVFAKAYGYAVLDKKIPVNIAHSFRIASVSKPITATAILNLREQGKLKLDDKVFGPGGILASDFRVYNEASRQITIRHLLEHTAGKEWTSDSDGPMFQKHELGQTALIRWVLKNRPITKPPGTEYAYSNFGYCLLGRVIEKLSGIRFQHYVRKHIFMPIDAKSFAIGPRKPANALFEVSYYPDTQGDPYGFPLARMDSYGGWKANAIALLKFSLSVDGRMKVPDLLSPGSIKLMTTPSKLNQNYALGWNVNQYNNRWHNGSLPGTAAIMVRTEHGYSWTVLLNKRSQDKIFFTDLDKLPWNLINGIKEIKNI